MASAFLISTAGEGHWSQDLELIQRSARHDAFGVHTLVDDPARADVIVFFEPRDDLLSRDLRTHPYTRKYREKCFVFDPSDRAIPFLPGVYASIEQRNYQQSRVRSGFYPIVFDHAWLEYRVSATPPRLLFSFVGEIGNATVRRRVAEIRHPRAIVRDTASDPGYDDGRSQDVYDRFHSEYAEMLADSKFVICPRGHGASTFRLFETMRLGRVPVIVSDAWVEPEGPAWETFSIRVREQDVARLPKLLEGHEVSAGAMGLAARKAWEDWFSERASFHRIVEWCLNIRESRQIPEWCAQRLVLLRLLEPHAFRYRVLPAVRRWFEGRRYAFNS